MKLMNFDIEQYLYEEAQRLGHTLGDGVYVCEVFNESKLGVNAKDAITVNGEPLKLSTEPLPDVEAKALASLKLGKARYTAVTANGHYVAVTGDPASGSITVTVLRRAGKSGKRIEAQSGTLDLNQRSGALSKLTRVDTGWGGARANSGGKREGAGRPVGSTSDRAASASRANGAKGGRPKS